MQLVRVVRNLQKPDTWKSARRPGQVFSPALFMLYPTQTLELFSSLFVWQRGPLALAFT
jgi:hypothetical protein